MVRECSRKECSRVCKHPTPEVFQCQKCWWCWWLLQWGKRWHSAIPAVQKAGQQSGTSTRGKSDPKGMLFWGQTFPPLVQACCGLRLQASCACLDKLGMSVLRPLQGWSRGSVLPGPMTADLVPMEDVGGHAASFLPQRKHDSHIWWRKLCLSKAYIPKILLVSNGLESSWSLFEMCTS